MPFSAASDLHCPESPVDVESWDAETSSPADEWTPLSPSRPIADLLAAESGHVPIPDYPSRSSAVDWILKVNEFYGFRHVTAYLSVNYLDRFLTSHSLSVANGSGWPIQLASVACLSVAAKMEETQVPLVPDLQILAPRFVFDPRTIRRMELLLMSALRWEMRLLTPFDFLEHFAESFAPELMGESRAALFARAADLVLRTRRIGEFLVYRPSVIAAAAIFLSAGEITDFSAGDDWVSKEGLEECVRLMRERLMDTRTSSQRGSGKPLLEPPVPQSPIGVLDAAACGSLKSHKSDIPNSKPSRPEPPN